MLRNYILLLMLGYYPLLSTALYAQNAQNFPPLATPPEVYAQRATDNMSVDGKLEENSWQTAPVIDDFFWMEPRQGGAYRYPTQVKVLYDDKNLYFGVFAWDSLGQKGVRVQDFRRDFIYGENDVFYIQLDPQNLRRGKEKLTSAGLENKSCLH